MTAPVYHSNAGATGKLGACCVLGAALMLTLSGPVTAQGNAPGTTGGAAPPVAEKSGFDVLKGAWVRPDGGYMITIKNVGPDGKLDAMYSNPKPLPFAKAQATRGVTLRAHFELRAGGYDGSTYDLTYDVASDRLKGTYYQAVAKQKFEVFFARK